MHISHCGVVHFSLFIVWLWLNFSAEVRLNSVSLENSSAFQYISDVKFPLQRPVQVIFVNYIENRFRLEPEWGPGGGGGGGGGGGEGGGILKFKMYPKNA